MINSCWSKLLGGSRNNGMRLEVVGITEKYLNSILIYYMPSSIDLYSSHIIYLLVHFKII